MLVINQPLLFDDLGPRRVQADFSGGYLSSNGGALILRQIDRGLALGYEDLNDHDTLRLDPLLAVAAGKIDPLGEDRLQGAGIALASPSTLNRLELSNNKETRYHKLLHDAQEIEQALLRLSVRCLPKNAEEIVLDLDAMGH